MYITVLHTTVDDSRVLDACLWIRDMKKDPTFTYTVVEGRVRISSPTKTVAYKRGSYFHQKFGVNYEVYYQSAPL